MRSAKQTSRNIYGSIDGGLVQITEHKEVAVIWRHGYHVSIITVSGVTVIYTQNNNLEDSLPYLNMIVTLQCVCGHYYY